ncbi:MAG TPA: DNA replication protein [Stellaceae bacterium]|nr:DNA replication protein [Stellaceae bacterium]
MTQLALDLPHRAALGRADFLAAGPNEAALGWIERWPDWPARAVALHGPAGCGKSHLAGLWQARSGGVLVAGAALAGLDPAALAGRRAVALDDADRAPERALLHLYNCCVETRAGLLLVARRAPAAWATMLPDLASRLRAMPAVAIGAPDDALLAAVLVKHFADRQLHPAPSVIDFLVRRMERSFAAAAALVGAIDRLALAGRRPVTLAVAREVLGERAGAGDASAEK